MYDVENLFDMQSIVGAKLETILSEKAYTKAAFCSVSGISRPTLDKLLSGNITSRTNYYKHITKVLKSLNMTPDMLMGNIRNKYSRFRALRHMLHVDENALGKFAQVSVTRLKEIEAGADAELAELRDLAFVFHTSVKGVLGNNFFQLQLAMLGDFLEDFGNYENASEMGFWGHIGILPLSSDHYLWYPITGNTRTMIYDMIEKKRLVIPCMNNKVLLINMRNVNKIVLLDEACDQPSFGNWDSAVDCGETPLVLYEALKDYMYYKDLDQAPPTNIISHNLCVCLDKFIKSKKSNIDVTEFFADTITIYYPDGKIEENDIDFDSQENISEEISSIYDFGETSLDEQYLFYQDYNGTEIFLNADIFSILELPLIGVEDKICSVLDEM